MREGKLRAELLKRVKHLGGEMRKVQWIGRKNAPDELVMLPKVDNVNTYIPARTFFIELKADDLPGEFPRDAHERAQHREHERMRRYGASVYVVQSLADLNEVLR